MHLVDPPTEQKLLIGALDCKIPKLRNLILAETLPEDYGSKFGIEVRERMDKLIQLDKPLGSAVDFSSDPGLYKKAKKFIRGTPKIRRAAKNLTRKRVNKLIDILKATKAKQSTLLFHRHKQLSFSTQFPRHNTFQQNPLECGNKKIQCG